MIKPLKLAISDNPIEVQPNAQVFFDAVSRSAKVRAAYEYVRTLSRSNYAPYHNLYHVQCVTSLSFLGSMHTRLAFQETEELLTAALFHDFNHSEGLRDDAYNISEALAGFYAFAHLQNFNNSFCQEVTNLIRCTQYPFVVEPWTKAQQIIRDADMMQITCPYWEEMIFQGLPQEVSILKKPREISFERYMVDFIHKAKKFYLEAEFYSQWGKRLRPNFIDLVESRFANYTS